MVDDEWRAIRQSTQGTVTAPSAAIASGNFQGYTTAADTPVTIYDPATGRCEWSWQNAARELYHSLQPHQHDLHGASEVPRHQHAPYISSGKVLANYSYPISSPQNRQSLTVRGDYYQSARSQWTFRYGSGNESLISMACWAPAARR